MDNIEGEAGDFTVNLTRQPRYVIEDKCTGCTTCVEYCPVEYPDAFNQEISGNKAIHIYFSQAIPLVTYIDESCIYLKEKKCRICETVCKVDAIDFQQKPEKFDLNVGAVILSSGLKPYDPSVKEEYGYGKLENVVTSMDFERLLCATGPYEGEILRASDQKHPHKIAWIQCIGSRKVTEGDNSYCSSVCCTYTQKQVILAKDHDAEAECTVFHNDIRSHGKDFETFFQRAEQLSDTRFIRSYASIVGEDPETKNVIVKYATADQGVIEEEFDMVVLSVGLNPPADYENLAAKFGIDLTSHGFCKAEATNPMETTRSGVFVSGAFQGPMDIPESVFSASGASSQCGEFLDYRRWNLSTERTYPPEKRCICRRAPGRCFCVSLRCQYRKSGRCSVGGGLLQDAAQCCLCDRTAVFLCYRFSRFDHGDHQGGKAQPGGCSRLLPQNSGTVVPRYAPGGGH